MSDISQGTVYVTAEQLTGVYFNARKRGMRGANIYTLSDLLSVTGETKSGLTVGGQIQQNLFTLSLDERVQVMDEVAVVRLAGGEATKAHGAPRLDRAIVRQPLGADRAKRGQARGRHRLTVHGEPGS